jgi:hypothetical protein
MAGLQQHRAPLTSDLGASVEKMLGVRTQQGKENGAAPGGKKGQAGLATLFAEGSNAIATHRYVITCRDVNS